MSSTDGDGCCRLRSCKRKNWNCRSLWICMDKKVMITGTMFEGTLGTHLFSKQIEWEYNAVCWGKKHACSVSGFLIVENVNDNIDTLNLKRMR